MQFCFGFFLQMAGLTEPINSPHIQATVWHELCRIKDEYLKILRVSISMSRTYYSGELKSLREGQKLKAAG